MPQQKAAQLSQKCVKVGMLISLCILTLFMTIGPAGAGNVTTSPDPELLKRFEAERDAAEADLRRAEELRKSANERRARSEKKRQEAAAEADAELCRLGVLPASRCP